MKPGLRRVRTRSALETAKRIDHHIVKHFTNI